MSGSCWGQKTGMMTMDWGHPAGAIICWPTSRPLSLLRMTLPLPLNTSVKPSKQNFRMGCAALGFVFAFGTVSSFHFSSVHTHTARLLALPVWPHHVQVPWVSAPSLGSLLSATTHSTEVREGIRCSRCLCLPVRHSLALYKCHLNNVQRQWMTSQGMQLAT